MIRIMWSKTYKKIMNDLKVAEQIAEENAQLEAQLHKFEKQEANKFKLEQTISDQPIPQEVL